MYINTILRRANTLGMFLNYQNIAKNYTPNNLVCSFPVEKSYTKLDPKSVSKPFEEYDAHGQLIGYSWNQGETLNLEFNIDGEIGIEKNAVVMSNIGQTPSETSAFLNQRAYNVVDLRSWTCTNIQDGKFVWTEDKEFTYDDTGTPVFITASKYLEDKQVSVTLYNFRREPIYTTTFPGNTRVVLAIDKDLSARMMKGIYYCSLTVFNDNINTPVFLPSDCVLLVR